MVTEEEDDIILEIGEVIGFPDRRCVWVGKDGVWVNLSGDGTSYRAAKDFSCALAALIHKSTGQFVGINGL